ncbi:MAG: VCBS repeat-containing protein [Nitrospinae bacterium]|nr:VCBS repeat-containing protein [Nitrospinota bacterium]MBL7018929.1 VCBS repeat-containing protein [Nitrospinaceae bacterium]
MKACKLTYYRKHYPNPFLIKALVRAALVLILLSGCWSSPSHVADNPASQRFRDVTGKWLFPQSFSPKQALFLRADQNPLQDLMVLNEAQSGKPQLQVYLNQEGNSFLQKSLGQWMEKTKDPILFFTATDLNRDGGDDLALVVQASGKVSTQILFNNRKGYFYARDKERSYPLRAGIDKVTAGDLDQDGDMDLFYFGEKVLTADGKPDAHQARLLINKGDGKLEDLTVLLMPPLPAGIRDVSFADYDGDGVVDIFFVYGKGQNRLLINNGVGKFADRTASHIPRILDDSEHADWADFDGDGDNDLLVVNRSINKHYRAYPEETTYFLENTGRGHFKKRSHKMLPRLPSYKAYLLDANGNTKPDALILTSEGVCYLQGRGRWGFTDETERRLPRFRFFREMAFADVNQDGFLDLFALSPTPDRSRIWLNRFD